MRTLCYDTIISTIKKLSNTSSIYIGCDSRLSGSQTVFGLVVILHLDSAKGGMCFAGKMKEERRMGIKERLMKEVEHAVLCATRVQHVVEDRRFEVHLDINPDPGYASNKVLSAAVGYVKGQGLNCRIKPEAFAASTAADYIIS
jgi:predicted RNase H-related nuclease YkuK (DUF458 family)